MTPGRLLAALALVAAGVAGAQAITLEQLVQRHLDWLARTDNYVVELRIKGNATTIGRASIDNTKSPAEVVFQGDPNIGRKTHNLSITGTARQTRAVVDRSRASDWALPAAPGATPQFTIFRRGATVDETLQRIRGVASDAYVVSNPAGGLNGLRMQLNPGYLGELEATLDQVLVGYPLLRNLSITIWFNDDGRIERSVVQENQPDQVTTTLKYLAVNVPASRRRTMVPPPDTKAKETYPSLIEIVVGILQQDEKAAK